jgi:hypothetical protein
MSLNKNVQIAKTLICKSCNSVTRIELEVATVF